MSKSTRKLKSTYRPIDSISPREIVAMHDLFGDFYENAHQDNFLRDLAEKRGVIVLQDPKEDDEIVGFTTIKHVKLNDAGRYAVGVFSGDTILQPDYWGNRALKDAFARYLLKLKISIGNTPLYWLLISKGYKTYLLMAKNFWNFYPRHDRPANPQLKALVDQYCDALYPGRRLPGEHADVLDFGDGYQALRDEVAPITDQMRLQEPAIRFFEEANPGWARGTELPCIAEVNYNLLFPYLAKEYRKAQNWMSLLQRPSQRPSAPPPVATVPPPAVSFSLDESVRPPAPAAFDDVPTSSLRPPPVPSIDLEGHPTNPKSRPPASDTGSFYVDGGNS